MNAVIHYAITINTIIPKQYSNSYQCSFWSLLDVLIEVFNLSLSLNSIVCKEVMTLANCSKNQVRFTFQVTCELIINNKLFYFLYTEFTNTGQFLKHVAKFGHCDVYLLFLHPGNADLCRLSNFWGENVILPRVK